MNFAMIVVELEHLMECVDLVLFLFTLEFIRIFTDKQGNYEISSW